jgi:hypothetical protein
VRTVARSTGRAERPRVEWDLEGLYRSAAPGLWRAIYAYSGGRAAEGSCAVNGYPLP